MRNLVVIMVTFTVTFYLATAVFDTAARRLGFYKVGLEESMELQRGY